MTNNNQVIQDELTWFSAVVDNQFLAYFKPEEPSRDWREIMPPDIQMAEGVYAEMVRRLQLSSEERLILMLTLAPHLSPQVLDVFFTKNATFDRRFSEFGGRDMDTHSGFVPTVETGLFLLALSDLETRTHSLQYFDLNHVFYQNHILKAPHQEMDELYTTRPLLISDDYRRLFLQGASVSPEHGSEFPAERITTSLGWEDLVVDESVQDELDNILTWIEHEEELLGDKNFMKHIKPGYRSLFYGPPGTGKTLTAMLLGKASGREVYRIDLSLIVSKYVGETEKNLSKIFNYAESNQWILFFDEADALFGKRSQTNSSNDRYANQEVAYLLQKIEDYPGVIILASNLKSNIDEAFSRRFQSMIYFPMPNKAQRFQIWERIFSGNQKPEPTMDLKELSSKYELSGGSTINIFRYSTLRALKNKSIYLMEEDIEKGIKKEYQKYGKTL